MNMIFALIEAFLINKTYKKLQKIGVIKKEEVIPVKEIFEILTKMNKELIKKGDEENERESSQKNTVQ